jgi:hypothetical protein
MDPEEKTAFSKAEREMIKSIADRDGISEDEAASKLFSRALARKVKRKTGRPPAQVHPFKRRPPG